MQDERVTEDVKTQVKEKLVEKLKEKSEIELSIQSLTSIASQLQHTNIDIDGLVLLLNIEKIIEGTDNNLQIKETDGKRFLTLKQAENLLPNDTDIFVLPEAYLSPESLLANKNMLEYIASVLYEIETDPKNIVDSKWHYGC